MKIKWQRAAIALPNKIPNTLVKLLQSEQHWDGFCKVDEDPPTEEVATPNDSATKDEPLGDGGMKALKAEREQRKALEQQLRTLQTKYQGIDPSEFQDLVKFKSAQEKAAADRQQKELEDQQNYEAAKQKLLEEHATKVSSLEKGQAEALAQVTSEKTAIAEKYKDLLISTKLSNAFVKANGDPTKVDVLQIPAIRGQLAIVDDDVQVVDGDGNAIATTLDEWVTESIKPNYLYLFKPEGTASGGGTTPSQAAFNNGKRDVKDFMSMSTAELARRSRSRA